MPTRAAQQEGSLNKTAYEQIKRRIADCELAPGEWLTERQLSGELGVGISPVRAALTRLDQEGLVRTAPRRGYQVMPLTMKSVDDFFEAWVVVGPAIARLAARNMTPQALKRYRALIARNPSSTVRRADHLKQLKLARERLKLLATVADNPTLTWAMDRVENDLRRILTFVHAADPYALDRFAPISSEELENRYNGHDEDAAARAEAEFITRLRHGVNEVLLSTPAIASAELSRPSSQLKPRSAGTPIRS